MVVKYSTIQVTPRMRRRLARYKLPGMSYEEVLEMLTAAMPPEEFRARHQRAATAASAEWHTPPTDPRPDAAEEGRRFEETRTGRMTPGDRMEEAYLLFEMLRGRG